MSVSSALEERCESKCELCNAETSLTEHIVAPKTGESVDDVVALCLTCVNEFHLEDTQLNVDHWRCLNESIWNPTPAVQVMSFRILQRLKSQAWTQDLISSMYMDEATEEWANSGMDNEVVHKDSNGSILTSGDTVVLIKDLNVKGAGFTAKRGTAVRRISLVMDNPEHIQGRINDQTIIILTKFVKKS